MSKKAKITIKIKLRLAQFFLACLLEVLAGLPYFYLAGLVVDLAVDLIVGLAIDDTMLIA